MATSVRCCSDFVSQEFIVEHDAVNHLGVTVDTIVEEFNQATCEAYLHGPASPKAMRSYRKICSHTRAPLATDVPHQPSTICVQAQGGAPSIKADANNSIAVSTCRQENQLCSETLFPSSATRMKSVAKGSASELKRLKPLSRANHQQAAYNASKRWLASLHLGVSRFKFKPLLLNESLLGSSSRVLAC